MKVRESAFWRYLKTHFDRHQIVYDRIEPTTPGTPDINAIHNRKEVWIELKSEDGEGIGIKPWQTRWAIRREAAGSHPYLLVKRKTAKYDQIELYRMSDGKWELYEMTTRTGSGYDIVNIIRRIFNG